MLRLHARIASLSVAGTAHLFPQNGKLLGSRLPCHLLTCMQSTVELEAEAQLKDRPIKKLMVANRG